MNNDFTLMARPLRIEYPGAWYHVMNRGADRQDIFHNDEHYQLFLHLLMNAHERYQLEVHAYCLMSNHYHLLVRTPQANLSKIMRHINGIFTQKYNQLNNRDGALFRGRYKALLVEANSYLLQLSRYIHLNPISAKIAHKPEDYLWSSYRFYLKQEQKPHWLYCNETLAYLNEKNTTQVGHYEKFVLDGINFNTENCIRNKKCFPILGSDEFIENIYRKHVLTSMNDEIPESINLSKYISPTIDEIINAVALYFNLNANKIKISKKKDPEHLFKKISVYLALKLTHKGLKPIAKLFNNISCSNVSQIYSWMEKELNKNENLSVHVNHIKLNFEK